jgi:DNA-binding NtrC family response regulator
LVANEKVLLVDDEAEFTSLLASRLEERGLRVETASNGAEAVEKVKQGTYDAVILDLAMPGMDGIETMKSLLEKRPDLQVILLTGHASIEKGVEAVKLGAKDFLEKPADLAKLLQKIKDAKTERMLLVEKKIEEDLKDILKSRGW